MYFYNLAYNKLILLNYYFVNYSTYFDCSAFTKYGNIFFSFFYY